MLCDNAAVLLLQSRSVVEFWYGAVRNRHPMDILGPMGGANGTVCGRNFVSASIPRACAVLGIVLRQHHSNLDMLR